MKKIIRMIFLLFFFLAFARLAVAQDTHVTTTGDAINVFTGITSSAFSSAAGKTYIFSVRPNQSVTFYLTDTTAGAGISASYQVFTSASATVANFSNNKNQWLAAPTYSLTKGYIINGAQQTVTISPSSTLVFQSPMSQSAQLAVTLASFTNSSDSLTLSAVFTENGLIPISTVEGSQVNRGATLGVNPVLMCGVDSSALCTIPQLAPTQGSTGFGFLLGHESWGIGTSAFTNASFPDSTTQFSELHIMPDYLLSRGVIQGNAQAFATSSLVPTLGIDTFRGTSTSALGNSLIWTPDTSRQFVLNCVDIDVTEDASLATAGEETISLEDGTTPMTGFSWTVFIPAAAGTVAGDAYKYTGPCVRPGYFSSAFNNSLNVNLSVALATGKVIVRVKGTQQ